MKKMNTFTILVSVASFIGGAIFGGYAVSRKLTKEFSEWRETLEEENRELYKEQAQARKRLRETIEKYSDEADERLNVTKKSYSGHNLTNKKPDLDELSKKYQDDDFDEHFAEREHPEDDLPEDPDEDDEPYIYDGGQRDEEPCRPPFEISTEELEGEFADSELTSITFYQGDEMLLDERGELISDVAGLLGPLVADALATCTDDCIYVHNDAHDTNYEVVIDEGSSGYLESVMRKLEY